MSHNQIHIDPILLAKEVKFKMSCSSGNGGQNVNRVATKATLLFHIEESDLFDVVQKEQLHEKLKNRINKDGFLLLVNQESRSAETNKKTALKNLINLIQKVFEPQKIRKKLKVPRSVKERRLEDKRRNAEKKEFRRKSFYE